MFHVRQKAPKTPDAFALGPSTATISWGENGVIVAKPMLRNCPVVKVNCTPHSSSVCDQLQSCYVVAVAGIFGTFATKSSAWQAQPTRFLAIIEDVLDRERDQLPLLIPVGLGIGVICWQLLSNEDFPIIALIALGFVSIAVAVGRGKRLAMLLVGTATTILVGFAAIMLKSGMVAAPVLQELWIGEFFGRIEKVEMLSARDVVRLQLATDGHQGLPPKVRVNLTTEQYHQEFQPGAIVRLRARLMPPAGPALPGGYDFARRAWFQGLGATGSALGAVTLYQSAPSSPLFSTGRNRLTEHIRSNMAADSGAIGAALVTGDQGHITDGDAQAMRDSGMAHLLSISGLHVTAVVGFIFLAVSRLLALSPWLAVRIRVPLIAASMAALAAVAYTLLTGAEVPTVRSCIAALLILTALAMGRDALTLRLVAFGATIVLLFWPEALAGPSFQLSFAAVATIVVLHELPIVKKWTERREELLVLRIWRTMLSLILTGVAIELILAPIALYHFHKTGLYGALANVVAIPLTTFFVMPMEAMALLFDLVGAGATFWWLAGQGISAILAIAHGVSAMPGAVSMLPAMPDWAFASIISGALIFGLLKTDIRLLGLVPFSIGLIAMLQAPRPDILVTGDGKHLALVEPDGRVSLLRSAAGEYSRDMLLENAGTNAEPIAIEAWPGASCSADTCVIEVKRSGKSWRVLATRTSYRVPALEMAAACKRVDIVVSDRWLPKSCSPRLAKADRNMLDQSGGLAFYLSAQQVLSVNAENPNMPWKKAARVASEQAANP